jgi:hypothetical protein
MLLEKAREDGIGRCLLGHQTSYRLTIGLVLGK